MGLRVSSWYACDEVADGDDADFDEEHDLEGVHVVGFLAGRLGRMRLLRWLNLGAVVVVGFFYYSVVLGFVLWCLFTVAGISR